MSVAFAFGVLLAVPPVRAQADAYESTRLTKLWETKAEFKGPQSVIFDGARRQIYVSNGADVAGGDGRGFISKVSLEGEIVALEWVNGLVAPRDMALRGDRLFVTSASELFEVDLLRAKVRGRYLNDKAVELKSVVAAPSGAIYAADCGGRTLYELKGVTFGEFLKDDRVARSSSLLMMNDELWASTRNRIIAIDLKTQALRTAFRTPKAYNSLAAVGDGTVLALDADGAVHLLGRDGASTRLLGTATVSGVTGMCFVPEERLLILSAKTENKVVAYRLN